MRIGLDFDNTLACYDQVFASEAKQENFVPKEWQGTKKKPCYIYLKDQALFGFAGLWSTWNNLEGVSLNTYSILTTAANEKLTHIHARMPIILPSEHYETWLAPDSGLDVLQALLTAYPSEEFDFHLVSKEINSPKNNLPEVLQSL